VISSLFVSPNRQVGRLYVIKEILAHLRPIQYVLEGLLNEPVVGYYQAERLRMSATKADKVDSTYFEVLPLASHERFDERKTADGVTEVKVRWLYYPANYDKWVPKNIFYKLVATSAASLSALNTRRE
jgi:hypothetical protein